MLPENGGFWYRIFIDLAYRFERFCVIESDPELFPRPCLSGKLDLSKIEPMIYEFPHKFTGSASYVSVSLITITYILSALFNVYCLHFKQ